MIVVDECMVDHGGKAYDDGGTAHVSGGRLVSMAGRPNLGGEVLCFWRETDNLGEFRREIHQFKAGRCKIWAGTNSPVAKRAQVEWRNWREVYFWKMT